MATKHICGVCGSNHLSAFSDETLFIDNETPVSKLSGMRCDKCGEIYLDTDSQDRYTDASNALVLAQRESEQKEHERSTPPIYLHNR